MARTLASIQRITALNPIPEADSIEVGSILGWKSVVRKGEYRVGDLVVFLEIDSVPPNTPDFEFLWSKYETRPNKYRIRTIRLKGQISQGLIMPLGVLGKRYGWGDEVLPEGYDVTEMLGVIKYESVAQFQHTNNIEGEFFDGVPKTDEERVQSATGMKLLEELQGRPYYVTVKCDGASMTVAMHDGEPRVASRNYRLKPGVDSAYYRAAKKGGLLEFVQIHQHLAVQGELVGPGLQKNPLNLTDHECLVFDIYDRFTGRYLSLDEVRKLTTNLYERIPMEFVPLLEVMPVFGGNQNSLLIMADGFYDGTTNQREGIVIRSQDEPRISIKAVSNKFLLGGGE